MTRKKSRKRRSIKRKKNYLKSRKRRRSKKYKFKSRGGKRKKFRILENDDDYKHVENYGKVNRLTTRKTIQQYDIDIDKARARLLQADLPEATIEQIGKVLASVEYQRDLMAYHHLTDLSEVGKKYIQEMKSRKQEIEKLFKTRALQIAKEDGKLRREIAELKIKIDAIRYDSQKKTGLIEYMTEVEPFKTSLKTKEKFLEMYVSKAKQEKVAFEKQLDSIKNNSDAVAKDRMNIIKKREEFAQTIKQSGTRTRTRTRSLSILKRGGGTTKKELTKMPTLDPDDLQKWSGILKRYRTLVGAGGAKQIEREAAAKAKATLSAARVAKAAKRVAARKTLPPKESAPPIPKRPDSKILEKTMRDFERETRKRQRKLVAATKKSGGLPLRPVVRTLPVSQNVGEPLEQQNPEFFRKAFSATGDGEGLRASPAPR